MKLLKWGVIGLGGYMLAQYVLFGAVTNPKFIMNLWRKNVEKV